jgi:hypothetical protein
MCVCIIGFVMVLFKMLSCNALSVVSGTCLFAEQARNTHHRSFNNFIYIYIYEYFKYFRRILVPWYLVNALMMTS